MLIPKEEGSKMSASPAAVGDVYYDSKVTKTKDEIMDRGSMIRRRSIITQKNRMVLTVDNYENKADEKPPEKEKAQAEEKERAKKVEAAPSKEEEDTLKPLPVWVYSVAQPDTPDRPSRKKPRTEWHLVAAEEHPYRDCWKPQDVLISAPGKDLPAEDHDPGLPTGVWGYSSGRITA
jgi:hypothetical protein